VAGGPHATFHPEEATKFCDSIVIGEVESVWQSVLSDIQSRCLKSRYIGAPSELREIPTPRYDLLSKKFFITRVVQATRGCPYTCSFCTVPTLDPGFRTRSVADVINDIKYNAFKQGMAENLYRVGVDVPFLSILTPFRGTAAYERYVRESRMIPTKGWEYFNGYNPSFLPKNMSPEQLRSSSCAVA
jgi:radical SAM superfamily enzyme with C-terminal helix-hairpin-helix motif